MRVLDLFAGCGGASLGLAAAGLHLVASYERDRDACQTHATHAPGLVIQCDLATLDPEALPAADLWWASPPCQGHSSAGKRRGAQDERDGFPWLLRLLRGSRRPRWLLIENVVGLTQHKKAARCLPLLPKPEACSACYFKQIQRDLRALFPWVQHRILDAADYGVPQNRHRVIVVCGPHAIVWPEPTHGPGKAKPWATVREALELGGGAYAPAPAVSGSAGAELLSPLDRPSPTVCQNNNDFPYGDVEARDRMRAALAGVLDRPAPTVTTRDGIGDNEADPRASRRPWSRLTRALNADDILDRPAPSVTASDAICNQGETPRLSQRPWTRLTRALNQRSLLDEPAATVGTSTGDGTDAFAYAPRRDKLAAELAAAGVLDRPGTTIDCRGDLSPAGHHTRQKRGAVRLTLAQLAILQGLPPGFVAAGTTKKSQHRQIGNAVPPRLAEVVARAVIAADAGGTPR